MKRTIAALAAMLALTLTPAITHAGSPVNPLDASAEGLRAEAQGDLQGALALLRAAADKGDATAQYHVARFYNVGIGTPRDPAAAALWYGRSADQGYVYAKGDLGLLYVLGDGVPRDAPRGIALIEVAAKADIPASQSNLCSIYAQGIASRPEFAKAAIWCRKAADQNSLVAEKRLGALYERGAVGVPADAAEAFRWWRKAADRNDVGALTTMATDYAEGRGVARNDVQALMWLILANARNQRSSAGAADITPVLHAALLARMSADQVAQAQRLAADWKPSCTVTVRCV